MNYLKKSIIKYLYNKDIAKKRFYKNVNSNIQNIAIKNNMYKTVIYHKKLSRLYYKYPIEVKMIYDIYNELSLFNYIYIFQDYEDIVNELTLYILKQLKTNKLNNKNIKTFIQIVKYYFKEGVIPSYNNILNNFNLGFNIEKLDLFNIFYNSQVLNKVTNYYFSDNRIKTTFRSKEIFKLLMYYNPLYTLSIIYINNLNIKGDDLENILLNNIYINLKVNDIENILKQFYQLVSDLYFQNNKGCDFYRFEIIFMIKTMFRHYKYSLDNDIIYYTLGNNIIYSVFLTKFLTDKKGDIKGYNLDENFFQYILDKQLQIFKDICKTYKDNFIYNINVVEELINLKDIDLIYNKVKMINKSYNYCFNKERKMKDRLLKNYLSFQEVKVNINGKIVPQIKIIKPIDFYLLCINKNISPKWLYYIIMRTDVLFIKYKELDFICFQGPDNNIIIL